MIATCSKIDDVLSKLQGVKRSGSGYMALCPAHDDKRPSLSVTEKDGKILLHCFAGCSLDAILAGLEIDTSDLFADDKKAICSGGLPTHFNGEKIISAAPFTDETGRILYYELKTDKKTFRPYCNGKYELNGQRRVLYRLPELLNSDPAEWVFLCEGPKDADNVARMGLVSTTNIFGGKSWESSYNDFLKGRRVCILNDNDDTGRQRGIKLQKELSGIAKEVRVLDLPGLEDKGDVSDWIAAGGTKDGLLALCKDAINCPLKFTPLSSVTAKPVQWLWHNRIPAGMFSMLVGNPGIGKSFLTMYMTSQLTTGGNWPDSVNTTEPGSVLLFSDEESLEYAIKPRLEAHGADCSKVFAFNSLELTAQTFTVQDSLAHLETFLDGLPDCRMIVFDPITAYLGDVNANANAEVRGVLLGLQQLAQRRNITVLGVSHFSKKSDIDAIYRTLGSTAFTAAARSVWAVVTEKTEVEDQKPARLLLPVKSNYSIDVDGLRFHIVDGRVSFDGQAVSADIDTVIQGGHTAAQKDGAKDWLAEHLSGDTIPARDVIEAGEKAGYNEKTLQRAATELGVTKRRSAIHNNKYVWSLQRD